jgi:hypothetical protein
MFSGALIYHGLGWAYVPYVVFKQLVVLGAHSDVRWDESLYKSIWLSPIMWVVERTISSPQPTAGIMASIRRTASPTIREISAICCSSGICCSAPQSLHGAILMKLALKTCHQSRWLSS